MLGTNSNDAKVAKPTAPSLTTATHKRRRIASNLRTLIHGLSVGDRLPSVTQLEQHFKVAKSTVELALQDLRAEGLIIRRQGSGTFVAGCAEKSPVRTGRPNGCIAISSFWAHNSLSGAIIHAAEQEARRLGYSLTIWPSNNVPQYREEMREDVRMGGIDAAIYIGSMDSAEVCSLPQITSIVLGEIPFDAPFHQAVVDNYDAGRQVGEYLWGLGHRRFAFVDTGVRFITLPRRKGFRDAIQSRWTNGVSFEEFSFVRWEYSPEQSRRVMESKLRTIMEKPGRPTAIFVCQDAAAIPMIPAMQEIGLRVPEDVSIVGFDDLPEISWAIRPALTTVQMPCKMLGGLAVQILHESLQQPGLPRRSLRLPTQINVRESSGPAPATV